jgi:hypothetical protein
MQRSITRNENDETSSFSSIEKLAVLVASKAGICHGHRLVLTKMMAQVVRDIFIKQNPPLHGVN